MSGKKVEILVSGSDASRRANQIDWIMELINKGAASGDVQVTLSRPSGSDVQRRKYHAMIADIQHQAYRGYKPKHLKAALVNQFEKELRRNGESLSHPGSTVWDWINQEQVSVRPSTEEFTKRERSDFIEFLYAVGSDIGIQWSDPELDQYMQQYREAQG